MPWHCPACNSIITHSEVEPKPRIGERYRCHVCRLTLEFDGAIEKLTIAPLEADHHVEPKPVRARAITPAVLEATPRKKKPKTERRTLMRRKADRQKATRKKAKPKHK